MDQIISLDQFAKFFKGASPVTIEQLYEELLKKRQTVISGVSRRINREFNPPIDDNDPKHDLDTTWNESSSVVAGKLSLAELLHKLHILQETLRAECSAADSRVEEALIELQIRVDELSNLHYGSSWIRGGDTADVDSMVSETLQSVAKCEQLIKRRRRA